MVSACHGRGSNGEFATLSRRPARVESRRGVDGADLTVSVNWATVADDVARDRRLLTPLLSTRAVS